MKLSVTVPGQVRDAGLVRRVMDLVHSRSLTRLWVGQSFLLDAELAIVHAAGRGVSCPIGMGVSLAPLRTPYESALKARSIAALLNNTVSVAFGAADPVFTATVTGRPWEHAGRELLRYAAAVRNTLDHSEVGEVPKGPLEGPLPPMAAPLVEVGVGALRPWTLTAAFSASQMVVTWLAPPRYVRFRRLQATSLRARTVMMMPVIVERRGRSTTILAREACGQHLGRPHYRQMLDAAGALDERSDRQTVLNLLASDAILAGTPSEIAEKLDEMRALGTDEVVLDMTAVSSLRGIDEALEDYETVIEAWTTRGMREP